MLTEKELVFEWLDKPKDLKITKVSATGRVFLSFTRNTEQERALTENGFKGAITYKVLLQNKEEKGVEYGLKREENGCFSFCTDFS